MKLKKEYCVDGDETIYFPNDVEGYYKFIKWSRLELEKSFTAWENSPIESNIVFGEGLKSFKAIIKKDN